MRLILTSLAGLFIFTSLVSAQPPSPIRLRWTTGQVLLYRVEHTTEASDVMGESTSSTKSLVKVLKRWQVTSVDALGIATMQMSIVSMAQERTTPSGDVLKFDSAQLEKSTPELKEALSRYLNTPLATLRVDPFGKVLEVKEAKTGAGSFENELPFLIQLPPTGVKVNDLWHRDYKITLPPPLGTGEKHDAVQKYLCKSLSADRATFALSTELKSPPAVPADAIPMWQLMPEGEVVLDVKNGRLHSAKLRIDRSLKNHQGENTSCSFKSSVVIEYVEPTR